MSPCLRLLRLQSAIIGIAPRWHLHFRPVCASLRYSDPTLPAMDSPTYVCLSSESGAPVASLRFPLLLSLLSTATTCRHGHMRASSLASLSADTHRQIGRAHV